jgi:sec-independent protein translocase protein TatB
MFNVGTGELVLILLLALIVLGPDKLPEVARQVGRWRGEFQRISGGFQREFQQAMDSAMATPPAAPDADDGGTGSFSLPAITGQEAEPPGPERVAEPAGAEPPRLVDEQTPAEGNGTNGVNGVSSGAPPVVGAPTDPATDGPATGAGADEPEPSPRMMVYGPPSSFG